MRNTWSGLGIFMERLKKIKNKSSQAFIKIYGQHFLILSLGCNLGRESSYEPTFVLRQSK